MQKSLLSTFNTTLAKSQIPSGRGMLWSQVEGQGPRVHKPRAGGHSLPLHTGNLEPLGPDAFPEILQVPGPLTAEMEARQATRRREQKAARRHREEQQRKRQEQEKQEQEEQQRFAALSDREKVRLGVLPSTATLPQRSDPFPGVQPSLLGHTLHH